MNNETQESAKNKQVPAKTDAAGPGAASKNGSTNHTSNQNDTQIRSSGQPDDPNN